MDHFKGVIGAQRKYTITAILAGTLYSVLMPTTASGIRVVLTGALIIFITICIFHFLFDIEIAFATGAGTGLGFAVAASLFGHGVWTGLIYALFAAALLYSYQFALASIMKGNQPNIISE